MALKFQDYYITLGVSRQAGQEEVHRAFRGLARKYHPDVNKSHDAEARFKQINEAYEVLKDAEKRKRYDALGANWKDGQEFTPPPDWQGPRGVRWERAEAAGPGGFSFQTPGSGDFSDFFEMFFGPHSQGFEDLFEQAAANHGQGRGQGRGQPAQGRDLESQITITLEEAVNGGSRRITVEAPGGHQKELTVKIPPGVREGSTIRLSGQGMPGNGGQAGDLLLKIHLAEHADFHADGDDLATTVAVAPWEAALGAKVTLGTLDGPVVVSIPPGTQSGQKLRLRGKGLPQRGGKGGDLLVEVRIAVPKTLTARERELLEQLARESKFDPRKG